MPEVVAEGQKEALPQRNATQLVTEKELALIQLGGCKPLVEEIRNCAESGWSLIGENSGAEFRLPHYAWGKVDRSST